MRKVFGARRLFFAPLVHGSDLAYRLVARRFGAEVAYTEMVHCRYFRQPEQMPEFQFLSENAPLVDRPLILQVAGSVNEVDSILEMINHPIFEGQIDGVDINCGCPQEFALRKGIGAGLLQDHEALVNMVRQVSAGIRLPLSVKLRLTDNLVDLVGRLKHVGVSAVTLHARMPHWRGAARRPALWDSIKQVAHAHSSDEMFVIGNGNVLCHQDALRMMEQTGCDAAMIGYSALLRPSIFSQAQVGTLEHIKVYFQMLQYSKRHNLMDAKRHVAWLMKNSHQGDKSVGARLFATKSERELKEVALDIIFRD